jgi:hypothetical protein
MAKYRHFVIISPIGVGCALPRFFDRYRMLMNENERLR